MFLFNIENNFFVLQNALAFSNNRGSVNQPLESAWDLFTAVIYSKYNKLERLSVSVTSTLV